MAIVEKVFELNLEGKNITVKLIEDFFKKNSFDPVRYSFREIKDDKLIIEASGIEQ